MSLESGCSEMEAWYAAGAEDDFNLMFPLLPDHWLNFAKVVEPELQRRGANPQGICGRNGARSSRLHLVTNWVPRSGWMKLQ
jgi:hypothetical protein